MTRKTESVGRLDSLHARFEHQAQCWPQEIALSYGAEQLTYAELNKQADAQARRFQLDGVRPGDLVAILLPRGLESVIQVLATLKAGAGYVPIDPNYPVERIEWMLESSKPTRILTHRNLCNRLWETELPGFMVDRVCWSDATHKSEQIPLKASSDSKASSPKLDSHEPRNESLEVAYIIFTSGSTGKPKGVMVGHSQVLSLLDAVIPTLGSDHTDTWTLFHSLAFDFSVWELWGALTTGGRLCIVPQEIAWSPESFVSLLRNEKVTVLNQTPSAFYALTHAESQARSNGEKALSLRSVIFGGEALNLHQIERWWALYPVGQPRLINMYGITETTVHVTWLELTPELAALDGSPIGDAISSLQLYLLNDELNSVADGQPGEIYVGGSQLALGYLGRPDLTASRFIATQQGERLYRSGDLAVRREGHLFYLGRVDRQLKIRGFRIEPAEVEAAIETHPAIKQCAVLPQPVNEGEIPDRLLAFVIPNRGSPVPESTELRQYLSALLPVHCLPSEAISVDFLPLTVNGKLDQTILLRQWRNQRQRLNPQEQRLRLLRAKLTENASEIPQ
jgi:nonribosomal peptide synthetase DhbF